FYLQSTYGLGACAVHALHGKWTGSAYRLGKNDQEARAFYSQCLAEALEKQDEEASDLLNQVILQMVEGTAGEFSESAKVFKLCLSKMEKAKVLLGKYEMTIERLKRRRNETNKKRNNNVVEMAPIVLQNKGSNTAKEALRQILNLEPDQTENDVSAACKE